MINISEVIETNRMIEKENLDVRTITLGISLLDCTSDDIATLCRKIREKIAELLEFGLKFDAVFFYSFHPAIYELLQSRFDFQEECRIICDDTSVTDDLNYTGYVVHYDLENAAKKLIDLLLNQTEHPEEPPQYAHVDFDMVLYRNGIPVKQTC